MNDVDEKDHNNSNITAIAVRDQKYRMLYDFTHHGYFTLSRDSTIIELNRNGYKMLGREEGESSLNVFIRYISHDTQAVFVNFLEQVFETQEKQTCRVSILNQKSPEIYTQLEGVSIDDNSCLILAIDITDIELLKKKATRYQNIFESVSNGILTIDAETGKITDVNLALTEIIGFDSEEMMGRYIWEIPFFNKIIPSKGNLPELEKNLNNHYTVKKENKILELELFHNSYRFGSSKEIQLNFKDITQRINYLKALEESKRNLELLNEAKDKFFAITSHDLRSPFTTIQGFADLLLESAAKENYSQVKQYATIIKGASWNAMALLSNLIEWSRSQNGKMEFKPKYFNLEDLLNEVLDYMVYPSEHKSIVLQKDFFNFTILADKAMMNTILRNLISNAIKFTNPGGQVIVNAVRENREIKISVRDNGIGIEPQVLEKLFDNSGKYHRLGTKQEQGSGLGLELCKEFIQAHNGKIWAHSKLNEGSTFYFTIPD
jgi:PAS domain S-box-containing protein